MSSLFHSPSIPVSVPLDSLSIKMNLKTVVFVVVTNQATRSAGFLD